MPLRKRALKTRLDASQDSGALYIKEGPSRGGDSLQGREEVGVLGTDPWDLSPEID